MQGLGRLRRPLVPARAAVRPPALACSLAPSRPCARRRSPCPPRLLTSELAVTAPRCSRSPLALSSGVLSSASSEPQTADVFASVMAEPTHVSFPALYAELQRIARSIQQAVLPPPLPCHTVLCPGLAAPGPVVSLPAGAECGATPTESAVGAVASSPSSSSTGFDSGRCRPPCSRWAHRD
jgi:hypothetical protein